MFLIPTFFIGQAAFEAELSTFEAGVAGEIRSLAAGAAAIEEQASEVGQPF